MVANDGTAAGARRRRRRDRRRGWIAVVAVTAGCVLAGYLLLGRGDDGGPRATADAVADALREGDDAAYRALTCPGAAAALRPGGEVPQVEGDVSVLGVRETDPEEPAEPNAPGALATLETTRVGTYYALALDTTDDGWCLAGFEGCHVDAAAEDNPYVPACPRPND